MKVPSELQRAVMSACLQVSADACAVFDAVENGTITMDAALAVVRLGKQTNDIAMGVKTLVLTGAVL